MAVVALAGCGAPRVEVGSTSTPAPGPADDGSTSTAAPAPSDDAEGEGEGEGYVLSCVTEDGPLPVQYSRLEEVWSSSNYLRMLFCEATPRGSGPYEMTAEQLEVARVAVGSDREPTGEDYLAVVAACTRLGEPDGPRSIEGAPASVLEAALLVCPEAPQADLMRARLAEAR
jgi:hypothetical protein